MARFKRLRAVLQEILADEAWRQRVAELANERPGDLVAPLFQMLLNREELVRWRAAEAFGLVVPAVARQKLEAARVVVRQMLWRLNEESGNMGWGVPEALGATLAGHAGLAREYHSILISYVREAGGGMCHGNYLDNAALRRGVLWGLGRLAQDHPDLAAKAVPDLLRVLDPARGVEGKPAHEALECHDVLSRGLACWILGLLAAGGESLDPRALAAVSTQIDDNTELVLFRNDRLEQASVAGLAAEALERMG